MVKRHASVTIEGKLLDDARKLNINVSACCETALRRQIDSTDFKKVIKAEIDDLENRLTYLNGELSQADLVKIETVSKTKEALNEFLTGTADNIIHNPVAMRLWSTKTGKSIEELVQLKRNKLN